MPGILVVPVNPKRLMSYKLTLVIVGALGSVLCVILRMQQILLI
jgi:hypothetical protein